MTTYRLYHPPEPENAAISTTEARSVIEADRRAKKGTFCHGATFMACYDYGKADTPPDDCKRCQLLHLLREEGEDLRIGKSQPGEKPVKKSGLWLCLFAMIMIWAGTLLFWSADVEALRGALKACERVKR